MMGGTRHAADFVLRLLRQHPSAGPGSEQLPGNTPTPARQREVRFSDFESVARLKERGGLRKDSRENWRRLWQHNPAMAVAETQPSMGWVLEAAEGIVGYQGSIPLLYQFGTRTLVAAVATGLVIEPPYRARGIGLMASFYGQRGIDLLLMTFATEPVTRLSKTLHAKAVSQRDYNKVLFWILDAPGFAKALAAKFGLGSRTATLGAFLGSWDMRLRRGPRGRLAHGFGVTAIEAKDIGDEFEALWQRKLAEMPRLLADRSAASLRWHFMIPGGSSTTAVLRCHRSGRLAGYAIVQHTTDPETGLRRSMLADVLAEQDDSGVTEALLEAAYSNAIAAGDHLFEVVGLPGYVRRILMRWKPYVRTYPTDALIYKTADEALARTLADENAWYAGPFDGDATLLP